MVREQVETVLNQMKRSTKSQASAGLVTLGQVAIPYCEDRVSLVLLCHPTIPYTLGLSNGVGAGLGVLLPAAGTAVSLNLAQHGSIVKGPFFIVDGAVPLTITWFEALNNAP